MRTIAAFVWLGSLGCSAPTEAATTPHEEKLLTGRSCALATASCGAGRCVATIQNQCDLPVTCRMHVESQCQTAGGETGPANASTKQVTQLAKTTNVLEAATHCGQGSPVITQVTSLECI